MHLLNLCICFLWNAGIHTNVRSCKLFHVYHTGCECSLCFQFSGQNFNTVFRVTHCSNDASITSSFVRKVFATHCHGTALHLLYNQIINYFSDVYCKGTLWNNPIPLTLCYRSKPHFVHATKVVLIFSNWSTSWQGKNMCNVFKHTSYVKS